MGDAVADIDSLRARARAGARSKIVLGVVLGPAIGIGAPALLVAVGAPGFIAAIAAILGLAQGIYLVFRGLRQHRLASGEVHRGTVIEALNQGAPRRDQRALTYVLQVEIAAVEGEHAMPGGVIVQSTNVVGEAAARAAVGKQVEVLWDPAHPGDAYVAL